MTRTSGTRAAAIRRAQQAKQRRDAQRLQREQQITVALADFFEQIQRAEDLTTHAAAKAARIIADAEHAAVTPKTLAAQALARLTELVETRAAVSELTGLTPTEVRELTSQTTDDTTAVAVPASSRRAATR